MDRQDRKAAIAAYKERKPAYGVFAVICNATGEAWVGCSRHVDTQQNDVFPPKEDPGQDEDRRDWVLLDP